MSDLAPAMKRRPDVAADPPRLEVVREQVVVKESIAPKGWRFVPIRDENNLIVEIVATPL